MTNQQETGQPAGTSADGFDRLDDRCDACGAPAGVECDPDCLGLAAARDAQEK